MSELGNIKGLAFAEFVTWYATTQSRRAVLEAIEALQPRYPDVFDPDRKAFGLLASRWYPAEVVHELLDRLIAGRGPDELDRMARDASRTIMNKTIRGVYKTAFALLVTPDRYIKYVDKIWGLHYDTGTPVLTKPAPDTHQLRYEAWAGHHPFICRLNSAAGYPIYTAMGCRDVEVERLGCISEGASVCEVRITWTQ